MSSKSPEKKIDKAESRKRRREWILVYVVFGLIILFSRFETEILQLTAQVPLATSILVLVMINLNILLIILFLFLIFRNLFKLVMEGRKDVPGTRLRTKLVVTFVALSLVPTMLLFFASAAFINNSIGTWFSSEVEKSLEESLDVAQTYYKNSAANALYYADQLARIVKEQKLLNEGNLPELKKVINQKQQEYNLGIVEVFSSTYEELVRASNPQVPAAETTDPVSDPIREAMMGKRFSRITPVGKADLIRGIVPVYSNWNPNDVVGVVVVNYYVPYSLVSKMQEISSSFEQYKTTKSIKGKIQKSYVILLLLIALVIIFLATWFGFHLARGITGPIQELAVGTKRIADGDLNVRIEVKSDDEIGTLVNAFNTMTEDLCRGQEKINTANLELKASNLELDQRRRYMEIVLKNVTAGVISIDKEGYLSTINKAAEKLLKINPKKALGKHFLDVVPPENIPMVKDFLKTLMSSGKDSIQQQITVPIRDNKVTLLATVSTLRDENHEFMGTVVLFDDLTHLIKAQRMAAWREVARRIAHEIKNPLTPVQLSAQRLRRRYLDRFDENDHVFDECTMTIVKQVEELKNLVNEFSSFARMPASNPTPNDLNEVITEAMVLYQEGHREINFTVETDATIPSFNIDRDQVKRVVINLLSNAVSAVEEEGEIKVTTSFNQALEMVILTVSDTGCGIPPEDKPRLFEPYFSTKKSGTGLGLAIVSTIISDHNGYIRVRDNQPRGTKFIIELPITPNNIAV